MFITVLAQYDWVWPKRYLSLHVQGEEEEREKKKEREREGEGDREGRERARERERERARARVNFASDSAETKNTLHGFLMLIQDPSSTVLLI